ncbi:ATP-binding protein [Roseitalea porphyridii]|uniref:C4-dicarboxylate transport sensor protein DctB n=1 Tax=Roseitalea porphyridii TaxID=1852022 RepID=A0A4P6V2Y9_9HYPH|nr:ATP-binding protein [Roseitalea porphyridii]QBK31114.1 sensor histidine kinase [Roseitalea porphyridii]
MRGGTHNGAVRNHAIIWLAGIMVVALAISIAALPRLERTFMLQAGERSEATLRLAVQGLEGALRRYEPLPALIAERPVLRDLLRDPDNADLRTRINEELRQTADDVAASDVYLMDRSGLTLVASNHHKELSFVGRSFYYRPYFTEALAGGIGRYFALGTTSGERGYFFATPVFEGQTVLGVVAVKFTVDAFEDAWRAGDTDIIVSDANDVIFMSNRADWHFRTLSPLSDRALEEITTNRQYPLDELHPLDLERTPIAGRISHVEIATDAGAESFVTSATPIAETGWNVAILTPTAPARAQALATLAVLVLVILFAGLIAAVFIQRRARLVERLEAQRATQELLERRVAERTADLNTANSKLRGEIEERKATEQRLRATQAELVQAGKLAALGQMSAALSHEFNQPLAAVKTYADNAAAFLDRGRTEDARDNVGRISQMADRMAAISRHLRNFARRPQQKIGPIPLVAVIDDALGLMAARLKAARADVAVDRPADEIWVMGGHVRLQQVIVNLLGNALDAMDQSDDRRIALAIEEEEGRCRIMVRDHGPGLDADLHEKVFDPFFTTKSPGKGLGLGLSISYNIIRDFGGSLSARNHREGGAVFTVDLARTAAPDQAAHTLQTVAAE